MKTKHTDPRGVVRVLNSGAYLRAVLLKTGRDARRSLATCGTCGRIWDDNIVTGWTPAPAGRCPFEPSHKG